MKDMEVIFSNTSLDFAGWMKEKCGRALQGLCAVIKAQPAIINNDDFKDALDNTLKMFALCHGNLNGIRCEKVYSLLTRYNVDGYYFLQDLIHGEKSSSIMKQIFKLERDENILKLIEENNKLNRTKIAEILEKADRTNKWISEICDDIENVHNAIKTWDWFYKKHCNDRDIFELQFNDTFIREIYEYFHSDIYTTADNN